MADPWSRGTAVYLRWATVDCPGTGILLSCMQGEASLCEPFLCVVKFW